jgi:hypothetical protein
LAALLGLTASSAEAHCDSIDGPVAKSVEKALESGNLNPVLAFAPASAEGEIQSAYEETLKVRALSSDARRFADRSFLETVVRLHRVGEGAPYTGLKPAGLDYGPVIPAAEEALASGDSARLTSIISELISHALQQKLAHLREVPKTTKEPATPEEIAQARQRVGAELAFISFAESIRQAVVNEETAHVD